MKSICFTLIFLWVLSPIQNVSGQEVNLQPNEEITIKKSFLNTKFYQGNNLLRSRKLNDILKSNVESYQVYKESKGPMVFSYILAVGGGYFLGRGIGINLNNARRGDRLMLIGAGLVLPSLILDGRSMRLRRKAVGIYNNGLKNGSLGYIEETKLSFTGNGICLSF